MAVFTYTPDFPAQANYKPRVRVAQFGDGYQQRVADGINTAQDTWSLSFTNRTDTEASGIRDFLATRGAFEAFDWTPPGEGSAIRVVCAEWSRSFDRHDQNTVTATFQRVHEP